MTFLVNQLYVHHHQVQPSENFAECFSRCKTAGLDSCVNPSFELFQNRNEEIPLCQRFPAGEGDTARVHSEDGFVPQQFGGKVLGGIFSTAYARLALFHHQFAAESLAFRVMAPGASKGTAFEENGCAYSWPVVDCKFLDAENSSGCHNHGYNALSYLFFLKSSNGFLILHNTIILT